MGTGKQIQRSLIWIHINAYLKGPWRYSVCTSQKRIFLQNLQKTQYKDCKRYLNFKDWEHSNIFIKTFKRSFQIFSLLKKQLRTFKNLSKVVQRFSNIFNVFKVLSIIFNILSLGSFNETIKKNIWHFTSQISFLVPHKDIWLWKIKFLWSMKFAHVPF